MTDEIEKRNMAVSDGVHRLRGQLAQWPTWTVRKAVREGYRQSGWVYKAVSIISHHASTVPVVVYNANGEIETAHPITRLFAKPHPHLTRQQLFSLLVMWLQLAGNGYMKKVGTPTQTKELWPVSPDRIAPIASNDLGKLVEAYEIITSDGSKKRSEEFTPDNMLHLRLIDPANPLEGIGPLQAAARSVDLDNSQQDWNLATMQNRGVVDGVFTFKKDLTQEQGDGILKRIKDKISGVNKAREPLVLGSEATYTRLGLTSVELDFLQSRKFNREEIFGIFGVPPQLVGSQDASTYSNFSEAMRVFWESTVLPILDTLIDQFNHSFDKELADGLYIGYDVTNVAALRSSEDEYSQTAKNYWDMGVPVSVINEKMELGIDAFEGWDLPWSGNPKGGGAAPAPTEEDDGERSWRLLPPEQRSASTEAKRRDKIAEGPLKTLLRGLLADQQVAAFIAIDKGEAPAGVIPGTRETWNKKLTTATNQIAYNFADTVVENQRGEFPRLESREIAPEAEELLDNILSQEAWILNELSHIEDHTVKLLIEQARNAEANGLSSQEYKQAILDTGIFSEARALRIARTVGGTATSIGQWAGAKAAGASQKVWSTSVFEVREAHTNREGETVDIDSRFSAQIGSVGPRFPLDPDVDVADRVNCRCFLQFH